MKVPFYDATREYKLYKAEFDKAIAAVVESGAFILGKQVRDFEGAVCEYTGATYAVGVANGSDALVIASDILGFKHGAEVITPAFTFFASASCIARLDGVPAFCDENRDNFTVLRTIFIPKLTSLDKKVYCTIINHGQFYRKNR